jgi:quercetin dioxygenase-like cupin family protein
VSVIRRARDAFIGWACEHAKAHRQVVTFANDPLFDRFEFLREDEWPDHWWDRARDEHPTRPNALPWWLPFNAFLHRWNLAEGVAEEFHDHPRWSVTVCLAGQIVERTPWGERLLRPGSIIIRSRKAIHAFRAPDDYAGEAWTLFIVGRREHRQNTYQVTAQ